MVTLTILLSCLGFGGLSWLTCTLMRNYYRKQANREVAAIRSYYEQEQAKLRQKQAAKRTERAKSQNFQTKTDEAKDLEDLHALHSDLHNRS